MSRAAGCKGPFPSFEIIVISHCPVPQKSYDSCMTRSFMPHRWPRLLAAPLLMALIIVNLAAASPVRAANRDRIEAFLNVTGFDVALDSIRFSASAAPEMLGVQARDFGSEWKRLTDKVFGTAQMHSMALDMLEQTLSDENLNFAVEFYAGDLGQRLVEAENASHMIEDDDAKKDEGEQIVADLVEQGSPRIELFKRMNRAIDSDGSSLKAIEEIQVRFLMAASAAGVVDLTMDADELRAALKAREPEMRIALQKSALAGSAFTYQGFSDDDLGLYTEALEAPEMRQVYELLNAVQYEIMANRFEALAAEMAELRPGQDI